MQLLTTKQTPKSTNKQYICKFIGAETEPKQPLYQLTTNISMFIGVETKPFLVDTSAARWKAMEPK